MPDRPLVYALGFSYWKRPLARMFLQDYDIRFVDRPHEVPKGATVALWANSEHKDTFRSCRDGRCLMVEDGFLRSVGLGANLISPTSWVVDSRGIYYDATSPSDLEVLLQTERFDDEMIRRAKELRRTVVEAGLTKYNVGSRTWSGLSRAARKKPEIVLVAGQVESDASLKCGALGIRTNIQLLRAARVLHPEAWLVYKPHPDVVAGLRRRGEEESGAFGGCDEVVSDAPMNRLLQDVDVVHVLTSLTGFEALLRDKRVVCHGSPFYAGWGLTEDQMAVPRRRRALCIDELVAGALIRYPRYVSRRTKRLCAVEEAVAEMINWRSSVGADHTEWWRRALRPLLYKD